jgi:hypothetical protein
LPLRIYSTLLKSWSPATGRRRPRAVSPTTK